MLGRDRVNFKLCTRHIREQSGAMVILCGIGSGRESADDHEPNDPLHVKIMSSDREKMDEARKMATDLLQTVYDDYAMWADNQRGKCSGKGKRSDKDRGDKDKPNLQLYERNWSRFVNLICLETMSTNRDMMYY